MSEMYREYRAWCDGTMAVLPDPAKLILFEMILQMTIRGDTGTDNGMVFLRRAWFEMGEYQKGRVLEVLYENVKASLDSLASERTRERNEHSTIR